MPKKVIKVHLGPLDPRLCDEDIAQFVFDELKGAGGNRRPEDPLFHSLPVLSVFIGGVKYIDEKEKEDGDSN